MEIQVVARVNFKYNAGEVPANEYADDVGGVVRRR